MTNVLSCLLFAENDLRKVDYAHEATGFPTWHRQYILWFEWEIQQMLRNMGRQDYHTFRTHYWDWRREIQMTSPSIFQYNRLGRRQEIASQSHVNGDLYSNGWNTICWYGGSEGVNLPKGTICDPNINTGPLLRCPPVSPGTTDPCSSSNDDWPTIADVNNAVNKPDYDTEPFDKYATANSFRNFMEGFDSRIDKNECTEKRLCKCEDGEDDCNKPLLRLLHNSVSCVHLMSVSMCLFLLNCELGSFTSEFTHNHTHRFTLLLELGLLGLVLMKTRKG